MKKFILFFVFAVFCFISNVAAQALGEQQGGIGMDGLAIQPKLSANQSTVESLWIFYSLYQYTPDEALSQTFELELEISTDNGLSFSPLLSPESSSTTSTQFGTLTPQENYETEYQGTSWIYGKQILSAYDLNFHDQGLIQFRFRRHVQYLGVFSTTWSTFWTEWEIRTIQFTPNYSVEEEYVETTKEVTDNTITFSDANAQFNNKLTEDSFRKILHQSVEVFGSNDEALEEAGVNLEVPNYIIPNLGPSNQVDYAINVYESNYTFAKKWYTNTNGGGVATTLPYIKPTNILARNVDVTAADNPSFSQAKDAVRITWEHKSSLITTDIDHVIMRADNESSGFQYLSIINNGIAYCNYTNNCTEDLSVLGKIEGDGFNFETKVGTFTDMSADPNKTYLYRIGTDFSDLSDLSDLSSCENAIVKITTLTYGDEISWNISNSQDETLISGSNLENNTEYEETICLATDETYTFSSVDSWGDGWNGGSFSISLCSDTIEGTPSGYGNTNEFEVVSCNDEYLNCNFGSTNEECFLNGTGAGIEWPDLTLNNTVAKCGEIDLSWSLPSPPINPESFVIQEETFSFSDPVFVDLYSTESNSIDSFELLESLTGATAYTHTNLSGGSTVDYKVYVRSQRSDGKIFTSLSSKDLQGVSKPLPAEVVLSCSYTGSGVKLDWLNVKDDPSVTSLEIYKDEVLIQTLSSNDLVVDGINNTWEDTGDLQNCQSYDYKVITKNCDYLTQSNIYSQLISEDLSNTFTTGNGGKNLECSTGYYGDRVVLNWENNNNNIIENFKIKRKPLGAPQSEWLEISETANNVHIFVDEYAEANTLYEYEIIAAIPCGDQISSQSSSIVVGFRMPQASLNGHIEYTGGVPVEHVEVNASPSEGVANTSIYFDGVSSSVSVSSVFDDETNNSFSFSAWVKIDKDNPMPVHTLFSRLNSSEGNLTSLKLLMSDDKIYTTDSSNGYENDSLFDYWHNIVFTHHDISDETDVQVIYVDGVSVLTINQEYNFTDTDIYFASTEGSSSYMNGYMDEISLWNKVLTPDEVLLTRDRFLPNQKSGMIAYYHCDEDNGNYLYDISKNSNGNFNKKNAQLSSTVTYHNTVPSENHISYKGSTNGYGNYSIEAVRYSGSGTNFSVTPKTVSPYFNTPHQFEPSQRFVFLGDGSQNISNQDFNDISAFTVTGSVYYHDLHDKDDDSVYDEAGDCPVKDAMIKIDGEPVIKDGEVILTTSTGGFEIEVPIGEHRISIEKQGHTFLSGYYPSATTAFNFQEDKSGLIFVDNTTIKIKGRVVGGLLEAEKELGMGLSINNIGQATFSFDSQNGLDLLGVTTNDTTGEYSSELLPIKYVISDFSVATNPLITQYDEFQAFDVLDLSVVPQLTNVYDTTFAADNTISSIDSASYHYNESFIYRAVPSIRVLNSTKDSLFTSEESLIIGDATIDNLDDFLHPIFKQAKKYESYIKIEETYKNFDVSGDDPVVDRIPVKNGQLSIVNNLAADPSEKIILLDAIDGDTLYDFRAGIPNLQTDNANPNYSFSKTWDISFETGPHSVSWLPNDNTYRGIVFGAKSEGTNFVTQGPKVVSHILRDPPGSASFAFYESGSTTSTSLAVNTSLGSSLGIESEVSLGLEFTVGLGYSTEVDIDASIGASTSTNSSIGHDGEYVETSTFTSSFSTNADDEYEGMWMDIYMGRSMNMNFGVSTSLTLIDIATCNTNLPAIECIGDEINGYKIGRQKGFFAVPGGYGTEFYYTQHEIVKALIPELEYLRNDLLLTDSSRYTSVSNAYYGKNNDDPIWGSNAVDTDSLKAFTNLGPSYTFESSGDTAQVDSVRWYNQQIRLWEQAVARNEKLKLNADPVTTGSTNISFDGGVGDVTYTYENGNYDSNTTTWESSISDEFSAQVGGTVSGIGLSVGTTIGLSLNRSGSHTWSDETNTAVGFTLSDGGLDDKYSIDILDDGTAGNGKVFKVQGGRTSCPYFDGEQTLYWLPGTELSAATIQMEQPTISISPSTLSNVPEDEPAVFNLSLGNNNPLGYVQEYSLKIVEEYNPHGAIIEIDGLNPNRSYLVPAGTSINKVLTIQKGPETLDYVDIMLVFHSSCQYDPTNNNDNIGDTVLLSVSFLAGCTDIEISNPDPNWVVNTDNQLDGETTLDVLLSDYNYNYYSLDNIKMQYKPTAGSNWVNVETYHKEVDSLSTEEAIPDDQSFISLKWNLTDLPDGDYDIRSITDCSLATEQTSPSSGHVDRVRPHNFGTPSPADGVLDPNDEIQINFNENINEAILGYPNFSINGVLNGSEIRHDASLYFNGTNEMTIPTGMNLQNKPFTIEMWVNAQSSGTLFSQGYTDGDQMSLAINADSKLELSISGETVSSNTTLDSNTWKHISVIYNSNQVDFLIDGVLQNVLDGGLELLADYKGEGSINVGENFSGNIHELRVWKQSKDSGDIYAQMLKTQSGKEPNLLGCWAMDDLEGNPKDKARARHANTTATWQVNPGGMAYHFEASSEEYLSVNMSDLSFRNDQDFTLELWFKANGGNQTILTNGSIASNPEFPEVLFGNSSGWTIRTNTSGNIEVLSNSVTLTSTANYSDSNWHHLALVKNDKSVTTIYIDYVEAASASSDLFKGFGGDKLTLGALATSTSMNTNYSEFLDGSIDEFRIWNKARSLSQITRDARAKLNGDNKGLVAYYPFETFTLNAFNQYETTSTINDQHSVTEIYASHHLTGTGTYNGSDKPLIRMARSVESVNFTYASNGDRVILSITDELSRVEGCILDIEVENVLDLYGNSMSSPITWTAYINQNQLIWDEQEIQQEKLIGTEMVFTTNIINQGGTVETYEISNLPDWLTATPSEGILAPNSYEQITFVVNDNLFIGDYTEDLILTGNNEYGERLELKINVEAPIPVYDFNAANYLYTMNFVGMVTVEDIRSRDENDILFAYVGEDLRGVTNLIYLEDYDAYSVFFSVYSNVSSGENVEFRLWDASEGKMQAQVKINDADNISFQDGSIIGSFTSLTHFAASNMLRQEIPLNAGWNWVSFNLDAEDDEDATNLLKETVLSNVQNSTIMVVKNQLVYAQSYEESIFGTLSSFDIETLYMFKMVDGAEEAVIYDGKAINPTSVDITINNGWNWIGYLGQRMLSTNEALSSLNPSSGDVIKSQTAFSMYASESLGWLGSLTNMQGGEGYMIKSTEQGVLTYPESSMYGGGSFRMDNNHYAEEFWSVNTTKYENSMSIVARIDHPDYIQPNTANLLGAFSELECVGNITASLINAEASLYFITVYGEDDTNIRFDYYDVGKDKIYKADNVLEFEANRLVGTIENPYPITIDVETQDLEVYFDLTVYPNPFTDVFDLVFNVQEIAEVNIQIFDVMGRFVKSVSKEVLNSGAHKVQIDGEGLSKGIYFIEVIIGEDSYKKMIVKS